MQSVKQGGIKYHFFWVFGMTRPGIEPRSPGPLANTLTARPMSGEEEMDKFNFIDDSDFILQIKWDFFQAVPVSVLLYGSTTWTQTK